MLDATSTILVIDDDDDLRNSLGACCGLLA
jgi:hypothetical protein